MITSFQSILLTNTQGRERWLGGGWTCSVASLKRRQEFKALWLANLSWWHKRQNYHVVWANSMFVCFLNSVTFLSNRFTFYLNLKSLNSGWYFENENINFLLQDFWSDWSFISISSLLTMNYHIYLKKKKAIAKQLFNSVFYRHLTVSIIWISKSDGWVCLKAVMWEVVSSKLEIFEFLVIMNGAICCSVHGTRKNPTSDM